MTTSTHALTAALRPLVSGDLRSAEAADAVAGVQPQVVAEPANEGEAAGVLTFATREGLKVLPRGGGTQLSFGSPPTGGDILLSLRRLNAVIEHAPHDQTVSVQAGLPLRDLQAHLGQTRQWLALDPPLDDAATVGGLIATNASGARRLRYGGVRDQIIGIRVALPDGTLASGGGKVVKNVAGYDLPKLLTGSLGTLGVIVAATFRLYPIAAASRTVRFTAASPDPLCELALRVNASTLVPSASDLFSPTEADSAYTLAIRFESGLEVAVADQAQALLTLAGPLAASAETRSGDDETSFWRDGDTLQRSTSVGARQAAPSALSLKVALLPTEITRWLAQLDQVAAERHLTTRWRAHVGHGLLHIALSGADDALLAAVTSLREAAMERRGSLVALASPPALAGRVDVWGPSPALALMRRLKTSFDPHATLNPGRFLGGI